MIKKIDGIDEVAKLDFVDESDKIALVGAMNVFMNNIMKPPIAKLYQTRNVKQVRLYVYDSTNWKYNLFLACDLKR